MRWVWLGAAAAFTAELSALAALGFWGFSVPAGAPLRVALGLGAPLAAAVLWGLFAAPKAVVRVPVLAVVTKVVVYGTATAALITTGHPVLAALLVAVALVGTLLSGSPEELSRSRAG